MGVRTGFIITPTPEQERIVEAAIQVGLIGNPEEALEVGVETLKGRLQVRRRTETAEDVEEWIVRFNAWADSHADQKVVLSDEAMSRESIHEDRGL